MVLTITTASDCFLSKEEIKGVIKKLEETEKSLLRRAISEKGGVLLTFYFKLREKLAEFNKITPVEFVAIATGVIDVLRSEAVKINITYAHKYDGLERLIPMVAIGVFPPKFYKEVAKLLQ